MTLLIRIGVGLGAIFTLVSALLLMSALNPAPSPLDAIAPRVAAGENRRAEAIRQTGGPDAPQAAQIASEAALRQAPYDTSALLRLALIDSDTDAGLGPDGLSALAASYRRVPFDRSVSLWRIRFCLEHWDRLPPDLRRAVKDEVFGLASEPGHRWPLRARLSRVGNPQGRVVASLWRLRIMRFQESGRRKA